MLEIIDANSFGPIDMVDLIDFESSNKFRLPEDYRFFLIQYNGGKPAKNHLQTPNTDVNWLYGMHNGPDWANFFCALNTYHNRIPSWYIPIGYDSAGNLFIMSMFEKNKGTIAFWDHENEASENAAQYFDNMSFVANSFSDFFNLLK